MYVGMDAEARVDTLIEISKHTEESCETHGMDSSGAEVNIPIVARNCCLLCVVRLYGILLRVDCNACSSNRMPRCICDQYSPIGSDEIGRWDE
jgi:hypothetical protein